jgi:hypothetical protein
VEQTSRAKLLPINPTHSGSGGKQPNDELHRKLVNTENTMNPDHLQTSQEEGAESAESRLAELEARLARLERQQPATVSTHQGASSKVVSDDVTSRRGLFKVAGVVATAAVGHSLLSAAPAAASTAGPYVGLGQAEATSADTSITRSGTAGVAFLGSNNATSGVADGVRGVSNSALGAGISGESTSGYGVFGSTSSGYAVYSNGRFGMGEHLSAVGPPVIGKYEAGDVIRDTVSSTVGSETSNVWVCVQSGTPGVWRKTGGPSTAGQFHFLSPTRRVYDSRPDQIAGASPAAAQGGQGPFSNGVVRTVNCGLNFPGTSVPMIPAGATGVLVGIAAFFISGGGFVTLYPTGTPAPSVLHAYWGDVAGHQASSLAAVQMNSSRQFDIKMAGGTVSIALDLYGYFM